MVRLDHQGPRSPNQLFFTQLDFAPYIDRARAVFTGPGLDSFKTSPHSIFWVLKIFCARNFARYIESGLAHSDKYLYNIIVRLLRTLYMNRLHRIQDLTDPLCKIIQDDPVRPEIPIEQRVSPRSNIFVLLDSQGRAQSAVCVAYRDRVPHSVDELWLEDQRAATVSVFYTIWSYCAGAGRELILETRAWLEQHFQHIENFVTLSPPTKLARRFHLRNGAAVLSVNDDSVNYVYL